MRDAHVPGAAIAIAHDGRVVWTHGFGETRAGGRAGHAAHAIPGRLAVQAGHRVGRRDPARRGILPLDEPVARVLRPWPLPGSGEDVDGITPRRLLSHTAGLSVDGYLGTPPPAPPGSTLASLRGQGGEGPATAVRVVDAPGTGYRYSGGGYTLLQATIEQRTGLPFGKWAERDVLEPLGMRDSRFGPLPAHRRVGRVRPRRRRTARARLPLRRARGRRPDVDRCGPRPLRRRPPARPRPARRATAGHRRHYGLGVHLDRLDDDVLRVSHPGVNRGWYARLLAYPDRGWAAVVLTNGDNGSAVADAVQGELEG